MVVRFAASTPQEDLASPTAMPWILALTLCLPSLLPCFQLLASSSHNSAINTGLCLSNYQQVEGRDAIHLPSGTANLLPLLH